MTDTADIALTAQRADLLRSLHGGPHLLELPNAWDAATAGAFAGAGFPAIATTSGGVANALGYADHEDAPAEEMLTAARRITQAVDIPVTVDFEAGYRLPAAEVARRLIQAGAAGMNLEDSDHHGPDALVDADAHAERLAAVKAAARAEGVELVLNARVDTFINHAGTPDKQLTEGLRRARLYRDAGADCVYPILLNDPDAISEFVRAVGTINLMIRRGGPISPAAAAALGVRRVTYATTLFRETMTGLEAAAQEIRAGGPQTVARSLPA